MPTAALSPELVETVTRLSPEEKDALLDLLLADDLPPVREDWSEEIARRIHAVASGAEIPMSREESERQIREAMRALGVELP